LCEWARDLAASVAVVALKGASALMKAPARILFITWDGPQVNYLESLFLPIFQRMRSAGVHVDILQFRWGDPHLTEQVRERCEAAGARYRSVPIWRSMRGLGPFASAVAGAYHVRKAVKDFQSSVLMPRSLMPALAVLAAGGSRLRPILFDADGLAADERVDFDGLSVKSITYRMLRQVEARMLREASSVIVRSDAAARVLLEREGTGSSLEKFFVVSNGRDERLFTPSDEQSRRKIRRELGVDPSSPLLVYAGSVGKQYRFDKIGELASELLSRRPDARLLVLTAQTVAAREEIERCSPEVLGSTTIMRVAPDKVPEYLAAADVGLAFRSASFSMHAVAPIKVSEYLLCGLPIVGTASVGDTRDAVDAGVFFDENVGASAAAEWIIQEVLPRRGFVRDLAREVGTRRFSLARSVEGYVKAVDAACAATISSRRF
jgi:glycosyltransferase involved in cell wall biosynthesis